MSFGQKPFNVHLKLWSEILLSSLRRHEAAEFLVMSPVTHPIPGSSSFNSAKDFGGWLYMENLGESMENPRLSYRTKGHLHILSGQFFITILDGITTHCLKTIYVHIHIWIRLHIDINSTLYNYINHINMTYIYIYIHVYIYIYILLFTILHIYI